MTSPYARASAIALAALACAGTIDLHASDSAKSGRAQKIVEKVRDRFDTADIDHDGMLSRDEAAKGMPRIARHFDEIDADHDGNVSLQEIGQYLAAKRKAREE